MVIELGSPVSESSATISKFYDPTDSECKFHKTRTEYCLSIGCELGSPWLAAYSHNHHNIFNLQCDGESWTFIFIYPSSKSWNNPADTSLPLNCASALKIHTSASRVASNSYENQPPFA